MSLARCRLNEVGYSSLTSLSFFFRLCLLSVASEHDGLRKDGQPDKRMSSEHGKSFSFRRPFRLPVSLTVLLLPHRLWR